MTDTDILLRLRAAIHMESARLAPQTSPEIELMREAAEEIERMRAGLIAARDALYRIASASHDYDPVWGDMQNANIAIGEDRDTTWDDVDAKIRDLPTPASRS